MRQFAKELVGKTFGKLTVLSMPRSRIYVCLCTCGNTLRLHQYKLEFGYATSCGCDQPPAPVPQREPEFFIEDDPRAVKAWLRARGLPVADHKS